jgi:cyclopropane fatty-acyl-phospholipid synthase-like methyltransferase
MEKPFAPSCERNKDAILEVLKEKITSDKNHLIEIGSGTGQHAVAFAPHFPDLEWQTSDCEVNHEGIKLWLEEGSENILPPISFEVGKDKLAENSYDVLFTANTLHIMSWKHVKTLIKNLGKALRPKATLIIYGPFNKLGKFTSDSNEQFDKWLKDRDPKSGIRGLEDVANAMAKSGLFLKEEIEMPANNKILIFTAG